MKSLYNAILCIGLAVLVVSCSKKKSDDLPLDKVHYEAVVVATENSNLISYEANTGNKLWEFTTNGVVRVTPVMKGNNLYAVTQTGTIYSIDIVKDSVNWMVNTTNFFTAGIAIDGDKLYIAADSFYCYDLNGNKLWTYHASGMPCGSAPQIANGQAYFAVGDQIHKVNATTGLGTWVSVSAGSFILSSVRVTNGLIYFGCINNKVYSIKDLDGSPNWDYTTGDVVLSSPLVYGGMCLIGSYDYKIHCIDTLSGLERWTYPTLERVSSSPTIHEATNSVLIGSYDYNLYCIDHVSGQLRWKYPSASLIQTSPVVFENKVYFTSFDRYMYCVDVRDGRILWKQYMNGNSSTSPLVDNLNSGLYPSESGMSQY